MSFFTKAEQDIYAVICKRDGIKASGIASELRMAKKDVNRCLYFSALMRQLCYYDDEHNWYALIRQEAPYAALYDFSAFYGTVGEFRALSEDAFMAEMTEGCKRIGRNLNDTRGLFHSFRDCRETMLEFFNDIDTLSRGEVKTAPWQIAFEVRLNRAKYIRVYADVLLITDKCAYSFEFKMKNEVMQKEADQAVKYIPYFRVIFGEKMHVIPVLVLTEAKEVYDTVEAKDEHGDQYRLRVSGRNMLFNIIDEQYHFMR